MGNKENIERFESLLLSTHRKGVKDLIEYIRSTDFYTAPASTRFHLSCEGGLLQHSLNVYDRLSSKICNATNFVIITSLLHDICKANFYSVGTRNVKNNETGKWEQKPFYQIEDSFPFGHGEKSVYIISEYIKLEIEEGMAIRWHMGFSEPKENYKALGQALEKFPLTLALMESDLEATYWTEPKQMEE